MHAKHPDVHERGLADDCPRCAEMAERPTAECDEEVLRALVELAIRRDRLSRSRSEAEAVASAQVLTALERAGRIAEVAPDLLGRYLRERSEGDATDEERAL